MRKQHPKMSKKRPNMVPKMGLSWGHVGFQNRPGRVQGRKKRIPEAIRKEDQKKYRKTSVWGGPQPGSTRGGDAKWPDFWPYLVDF